MEAIYKDFSPKGVKFYYLYKQLAHPGANGFVDPYSQFERLRHANFAAKRIGMSIPWLVDTMDNAGSYRFAGFPNCELVLDKEGKLIRMRPWNDPVQLRADLEQLVGKVEKPTLASSINLSPLPKRNAEKILVPDLPRPQKMIPLSVTPCPQLDDLYYVKLFAESGTGRIMGDDEIFLRFVLDPIYDVHWNNLAQPIQITVEWPSGLNSKVRKLVGPKLKIPSDSEAREFSIKAIGSEATGPVRLRIDYMACEDHTGKCMTMTQSFRITSMVNPPRGKSADDDCQILGAE